MSISELRALAEKGDITPKEFDTLLQIEMIKSGEVASTDLEREV